jgi:acetyl esterase
MRSLSSSRIVSIVIGLSSVALIAACQNDEANKPPKPEQAVRDSAKTPEAPKPVNAPESKTTDLRKKVDAKNPLEEADDDMKKVLDELAKLDPRPLDSLTPEEARKQPTPADAVKAILAADKADKPLEVAKVEEKKFQGADGKDLAARVYTPKTEETGLRPVVVYFHGGGFVVGGIDAYDASARAIADGAEAIVVSADYRRAPEHKFPAAHDDAYAAYQWVLSNASSFGGDPARVAVAGESAGGNLAANVSILARDKGAQMPLHQLLVYPVAQSDMTTTSYQEWKTGKPLDEPTMRWFVSQYTKSPAELKDPRLDLVNAKLDKLPPTTIVLAEIDPLREDGELLAKQLEAAKVPVESKTYEGVTHEFFGMGAVVSDAKSAMSWATSRLDGAFDDAKDASAATKDATPRQ